MIPDWSLFYQGQVPMYSHFEHYCGHLAVLQKQMADWKPQKAGELFQPGYRDRFSWYTWISIIFALLGVLVIATSILQTYWAYQGTQAAVQSLSLQRIQMNLTSPSSKE
jgi:H+/Cl- antiporter ClcA